MKIGKEISQNSFKCDYHKAAINLFFTYNWANYFLQKNFGDKDLTSQQYNALRILRGQYPKPCNLKLLKERMLDRMSDVSRITDKLFKKGFIERKISEKDRRNIDILVSQKGLAVLAELDFLDDEFKKIFSNLDEKEIRQLNDLLDKLRG